MRFVKWFMARRSAKALSRAAAAVVEEMESRRLLSSASFAVGILTVTGTAFADTTTIYETGGTVFVSDDPSFLGVNEGSLISIQVRAGSGNDAVTIANSIENTVNSDIEGEGGNDTLTGAGGIDNLEGGDDADTLDGQAGDDFLYGGAGNDSLRGDADDDYLEGGTGADILSGGSGTADKVDYITRSAALTIDLDGTADDGASGENDNVMTDIESIQSGSGNDTLRGNTLTGASDVTILGGGGNDVITGGKGDDSLNGEADHDTIYAVGDADGTDTLGGGTGTDMADYGAKTANLTITIEGTANDGQASENDNVLADFEQLRGGSGDDSITGDGDDNTIYGEGGSDTLRGEGGNDVLNGGTAWSPNQNLQYLYGGDGNDTLGGWGNEGYGEVLNGEGGNDDIFSYGDSTSYADTVDGGSGDDTVHYDDGIDSVSNCETLDPW